jgi:hypothetical protein
LWRWDGRRIGFLGATARLRNGLRGEQQQQAGRCKQTLFVAISLKAGKHFHAFFSSVSTLEAGLVYKVATTELHG